MIAKRILNLAETYLARAGLTCFQTHFFHDLGNVHLSTLKATFFVLWHNPTAAAKQHFDDRQEVPLDRASEHYVVLASERCAQDGPEFTLPVQRAESGRPGVFVRAK